ncbi:MAG: porin [Prosthecochloris sp.]|nr:porin [Prosthecochloris sp.]
MKKALSLLMVFVVAAMWSVTSFAADKYVSGNIGISWISEAEDVYSDDSNGGYIVDFDSGITLLGALGCDYGDYRMEGELGYQTGDYKSIAFFDGPESTDPIEAVGDFSILSLMVNGYYDIDLGGVELSPTVGVGVAQVKKDGFAFGEMVEAPEEYRWSASEVTFAYQAGVGLGIPVSDNITIDARYRYFATTDYTFEFGEDGPQFNTNRESHSALLGMRINL